MARKCGFFDCNNSVVEGTMCQSCQVRKENNLCSACRQPEPQENKVLSFHPSLVKKKYVYEAATLVRDKLPAPLQAEFDQLLPQLKLTVNEQQFIAKAEKFLADFLAEKGGKQDHIDWLNFCSVCNSELNKKAEDLFQTPQNKPLAEGINEKEEKLEKFFEDKAEIIKKSMSKEEWEKWIKETEEKLYKQIATNPDQNQQPNQPDQNQPNQNDNNSAKITQLEQEINQLKTQIGDLKNSPNPSPNSNNLQAKENQLRKKEDELNKLKSSNQNPLSNSQPNDNSNLGLYIVLGVMGVVMVLLFVLLILSKKKKKNLDWQINLPKNI